MRPTFCHTKAHFTLYNKVLRAYIIEFNRCYYIPLTQATKNISFTGHRSVELMRELKQTTTTAKMRRKQHLATLAICCDAICCDLIKLLEKSKNKPGNAQVTWQEGSLVKTRLTQISDSRVKSGNFPKLFLRNTKSHPANWNDGEAGVLFPARQVMT